MATLRTRPCVDCGELVTKRARNHGDWLCRPCAGKRTADNANELANRQGPAYDRWREAMRRATSGL